MTEQANATAGGKDAFPVGSWERPDPGGVVLRGAAAALVADYEKAMGEPPPCWVRRHVEGGRCGRVATMQVYGLMMCEPHGEEAAAGALEEIAVDLENELGRPMNPHVRALSPHLEHALLRAGGFLPDEARDHRREDAALLVAFPLRRDLADAESLAYAAAGPEAAREDPLEPPQEAFMWDRRLACRHLRLAFEEGAMWLVEALEPLREDMAAQAAYALALDREAGLR